MAFWKLRKYTVICRKYCRILESFNFLGAEASYCRLEGDALVLYQILWQFTPNDSAGTATVSLSRGLSSNPRVVELVGRSSQTQHSESNKYESPTDRAKGSFPSHHGGCSYLYQQASLAMPGACTAKAVRPTRPHRRPSQPRNQPTDCCPVHRTKKNVLGIVHVLFPGCRRVLQDPTKAWVDLFGNGACVGARLPVPCAGRRRREGAARGTPSASLRRRPPPPPGRGGGGARAAASPACRTPAPAAHPLSQCPWPNRPGTRSAALA